MNDKLILGIESSCDETSASVVRSGRSVLSEVTSTQIDIHKIYGGVVPEIASRNHLNMLPFVVSEALDTAGVTISDIDAIGVTYAPGLVGALLVGLSYAKAMAYAAKKTLIGVHHIKGHIAANYLQYNELEPPFLSLVVSGGHTNIVLVNDYCNYVTLGKTIDDAAGEAYDKAARALGFEYPGGPQIDAHAKKGNANAVDFPRVMLEHGSLDFSFSGLKSAVLNYLNTSSMKNIKVNPNDISASFQEAVIDVLCFKIDLAAQKTGQKIIALSGGVAANSRLRERMVSLARENGYMLYMPELKYCTDNASMIASCAYYELMCGNVSDIYLNAAANMPL
jgi:N6-L-threonylcarbamoyladenine synthase